METKLIQIEAVSAEEFKTEMLCKELILAT